MTPQTTPKQSWQTGGTYYYQTKMSESISEAVIHAVAAVSDRSPIPQDDPHNDSDALPPLFEAINPDALDEIFTTCDDDSQPSGIIKFVYSGYGVTVEGTGLVSVTEEMQEGI